MAVELTGLVAERAQRCQRIEHQALRLEPIHLAQQGLHPIVERHLRELEQGGGANGAGRGRHQAAASDSTSGSGTWLTT